MREQKHLPITEILKNCLPNLVPESLVERWRSATNLAKAGMLYKCALVPVVVGVCLVATPYILGENRVTTSVAISGSVAGFLMGFGCIMGGIFYQYKDLSN